MLINSHIFAFKCTRVRSIRWKTCDKFSQFLVPLGIFFALRSEQIAFHCSISSCIRMCSVSMAGYIKCHGKKRKSGASDMTDRPFRREKNIQNSTLLICSKFLRFPSGHSLFGTGGRLKLCDMVACLCEIPTQINI